MFVCLFVCLTIFHEGDLRLDGTKKGLSLGSLLKYALYNLGPPNAILRNAGPWYAGLVLPEIIINESFPTPYLQASTMKLAAIILTGNGLYPFPVVMKYMQGDSMRVKSL